MTTALRIELMNATEYVKEVETLFVLPDTVTRVKELIDSEEASMEDIAEVITFDPVLSSQVLKIANSALYNYPSQIDNTSRAIQVMGTTAVYDLVISYGVAKAFEKATDLSIDTERFWEQSVGCALMAKLMAERSGVNEPVRLFLCGLLHNIGELVVAVQSPDVAAQIQKGLTDRKFALVQSKELGITYTDISAELAYSWNLPPLLVTPISLINAVPSDKDSMQTKSLRLAAHTMDLVTVGLLVDDIILMLKEEVDDLQISRDELSDILDLVSLETLNILSIFNPGAVSTR